MKVGDLVAIKDVFTAHGVYESDKKEIGMIILGPNEVGKIRVLMSSGERIWLHCSEVEFMPKERRYLKE